MSHHGSNFLILLALLALLLTVFWRQVILFLVALVVAVFCCGLFYVAALMHA